MRKSCLIYLFLLIIFILFVPISIFYYKLSNEIEFELNLTLEKLQKNIKNSPFLVENNSEICEKLPENVDKNYPMCREKMRWIKSMWKSHQCFSESGVDGSICSFRLYLSDFENHCPPIQNNGEINNEKINENLKILRRNNLFYKLNDVSTHFKYIKTRITNLWEDWIEGLKNVTKNYPNLMKNRERKKILIFMGFLANEKKLKLSKMSESGGPLGELLQWSDLIASLFVLGHNIEVKTSKISLLKFINNRNKVPCQPAKLKNPFGLPDIVFTDIMGLNIMKRSANQFLSKIKCRIRLLDSFGTHVEFSNREFYRKNAKNLEGVNSTKKNPWGGHGLNLKQHWTFFPHSHDNTFLGFAVQKGKNIEKDPKIMKSLIYGKEKYMWKGFEEPINILKQLTQVHATVGDADDSMKIFENITNHGFLSTKKIAQLLDEIHIFFGLGFPLEGPAPLEAVAHGAIFINAKFERAKSRKNYGFMADKPTLREFPSQCPYMEQIGEPHVITIDIFDKKQLKNAIEKVKKTKTHQKVPEEFTPQGMLLRISLFLEHQDFCDLSKQRWPPIEALKILKSEKGESCEQICLRNNLFCESSFFDEINNEATLKSFFENCSTPIMKIADPKAPFNCNLQSNSELFSCASKTNEISRVCPCRDYLKEQHSICRKCV